MANSVVKRIKNKINYDLTLDNVAEMTIEKMRTKLTLDQINHFINVFNSKVGESHNLVLVRLKIAYIYKGGNKK